MDNVYVFCGSDKFSINRHIKSIIEKCEYPAIIRFDNSSFSIDKAIDEIRFKDLFNPSKIIIMEYDIFHADKNTQNLFTSVLRDAPLENFSIFICPKILKSSPINKKVFSKSNSLTYNPPKNNSKKDTVKYISGVLNDLNISISDNLIYLMIDLMGLEVSNILFEIKRLSDKFGKLDENIIKKNIEKTYFNIFDLTEAFSERDIKKTLTMYDMFIENYYGFHEIFTAIYKQIRLMFMIKLLMKDYGMKNYRYMANKLKIHPFQVKKNIATINKYSYNELENMFNILVDFQRKMYNNCNSSKVILKVMITQLMSK